MKIANEYNHLNAREFLIVNKGAEYAEIRESIAAIDANQFLKISCEVSKLGQVFYSQSDINKALKELLHARGRQERRVSYYVTGDEATTRDIIPIRDKEQQRHIIESRGFSAYATFNQVDFQKGRVAVEVQFGKYFSVAYDLHVKHTFFYSRNDIDAGVEIIPTKLMEEHMDTGVAWFENEVTNVIREGRTNPAVPILIVGIEPDSISSINAADYSDEELIRIIRNSDVGKIKSKIREAKSKGRVNPSTQSRIEKINRCFEIMGE